MYSWDNNPKPKTEVRRSSGRPAATRRDCREIWSKALEQTEQKRSAEQTALIRDTFEYSSPQLFAGTA